MQFSARMSDRTMTAPAGISDSQTSPLIAVVDGDQAECEALDSVLSRIAGRVENWQSAEAFLEDMGKRHIDLMVVCVTLPGMNGIELVRRLRALAIDTPIILVSGDGDVPMAVDAIRAGAVDFLERPLVDRVLLRRAQQALDHAA